MKQLLTIFLLVIAGLLHAQDENTFFEGGTESGGGAGTGGEGGPLPIELLRFEARNHMAQVILEWSTATEIDNDFFTLERSRDAVRWEAVAKIEGAGTHFGQLDYTYTDARPLFGTSYYRLKQTDFDGSFSYSPVRAVTVEGDEVPILLYPNPARLEVNLLLQADLFHVRIFDASGREVLSATNTPTMDISALVPGRYTVEVRTLEDRYVLPLMVN